MEDIKMKMRLLQLFINLYEYCTVYAKEFDISMQY